MGVEYFSLRFGVASPFLLKRTRVFLCLWSKPWFWKPEGLLFDSVEERLILACEWKKQLFVCCWLWEGEMEDRSPLLCTLVAHCSFGAATNNKSKNKADMQRVQECVYTCMYIYIYIYIYTNHTCVVRTHIESSAKTQYAVRCPGRFAAWLVWKDYFPLKRQEAKWERFFWAGRWCRRGSDLMRTDTLKQLPNWNHLSKSDIWDPVTKKAVYL